VHTARCFLCCYHGTVKVHSPHSALCFRLSQDRSAGVVTFDSSARVQIHLNVESTSNFLSAVDQMGYSSGGTDVLAGLQTALSEINSYSQHDLTVVGKLQ
jgi:uncharacterized protein with von Willebrand factor type A (vWA) domain